MMQQPTTREQREAILRLFRRDWPDHPWSQFPNNRTFRAFRSRFRKYGDYIGGEWHGMFIGIERDGYTHS